MQKTKQIITLTKEAADKIKEFAAKEKMDGAGLKLFVFPGGCSGVQYGLDFEKEPGKTDKVIEQHGVRIFIEKANVELVEGTRIDFIETPQGSGFKIENPNAKPSCSCGKGSC